MEERYIAAVDLGTSKIAFTVAKVKGGDVQIIFYREKKSEGIRRGEVLNPAKASIPVKEALEEAQKELGIRITRVVAGLPRYKVREECAPARVERNDPESCITAEEISGIRDLVLDTYCLKGNNNEEIYGAVAQTYDTDGYIQNSEDDIIGMTGGYIEANFKLFVGSDKASRIMDKMMENVGVPVVRKYFLPDQTARAVLNSDELSNGVALIEIGAGVSSVSVYRNNVLKHYCSIPFGGRNVTWDIRNECGFREKLSENIKKAYGNCLPDKLLSMEEKTIQVNNEDGSCEKLPNKYLAEIINARMREIIEALLYDLVDNGFADKLRSGIVVTGGGANLTGCAILIREMSGLNVRTGYPRSREFSIHDCPGIDSTTAVSSIGMILNARNDSELNCAEIMETGRDVEASINKDIDKEMEGTVFGAPEAAEGNGGKEPAGDSDPKAKGNGGRKPDDGKTHHWGKKFKDTMEGLFDDMK